MAQGGIRQEVASQHSPPPLRSARRQRIDFKEMSKPFLYDSGCEYGTASAMVILKSRYFLPNR
jgi:hypothetical protein